MLSAAVCLAFFGFLRCGEFTIQSDFDPSANLSLSDISFDTTGNTFTLSLKRSKCDPFRQGTNILYCRVLPTSICPVGQMSKYVLMRKQLPISPDGPLLVYESQALTRTAFLSMLHTVLERSGIDSEAFSGHSFRSGAATTCALAKIEDHVIKTLGRWSSECYTRYIKNPPEVIHRAQKAMASTLL